ncbi:MFS transporter [Akkermansia glycaniphila]|uniref:Major facilitator superfamily n=1 Tax=Akkermansia glycaniphila TaxID=1679444 RepID=A0A1C7P966_9BACT|nr:MFS transporter [Akkermansia glycaniphila]OCA02123.1 hypothetical protein AC781_13180 [Akkermansia glycaniphila]SEH94531.1 major facilitator superfamily [Akkermansia glycaniphila]
MDAEDESRVKESTAERMRRRVLVLLAFGCTILTFINMGSITAATPDLSGTFVVGVLDVSWSGAACPLGTALSFSVASYLWARIGLRRALRFGLLLMVGGSALALVADHFLMMIVARLVQGFGGGLALAYGAGVMAAALPREALAWPMGLRLYSLGMASCISPVVGCFLVQYGSWRMLFVLTGAAALLMALVTSIFVPNARIPKQGKFDWFSFLSLGMSCLCMLMVLIDGETEGWTSPYVMAWGYGAFCFLALTAISCLNHKSPLLDFSVLKNYRFMCALIASLCNIFCVCWIRAGTVQFMRNTMSYDPVHIALVFSVLVASFCVGAACVLPLMVRGKLALRVGMMAGLLGLSGAAFLLARLHTGSSWLDVAWPLAVFGVGYAFCINTGSPLIMRGVPPERAASSARTMHTVRFLFIALFASSVSTVLAHMKTNYQFSVAEQTREGSPGAVATMDMWQRHFADAGQTAGQVHAGANAVLNKAVSLQSQIFSTDYFYLCIAMVGAAGVLFALFCFRVRANQPTNA